MKKFLSLVLALVMTMSLVTVSAGAKDFTDSSKINYKEAVDVMSAAKVIDGYAEGDFRPTNTLTRGAAAKIICNLILGPTTASALVADAAPYKDVPTTNTFAGYIAYCQKEGIISGYADGTFRPGNSLTGYAFMKMLLGALGYDAETENYTGNNWSINVAKRALNIGLDDDLTGDFNGVKAVNREEACLYAFNTLKATMVEYENNNSVTVNGITFTNKSAAKEMANTGKTDGNIKDDGLMQFAEKYFSKLSKKPANDDFKRPSTKWVYDGDSVGTYADNADAAVTLGSDKDFKTVLTDSDYMNYDSGDVKADAVVYVNGFEAGTYKDLKSVKLGVGDVVEAFENDDDDVTRIVVIRYLPAQIDEIDDSLSSSYTKKGASYSISFDKVDDGISNIVPTGTYYDSYTNDSDKELPGFNAKTYVEDAVIALAPEATNAEASDGKLAVTYGSVILDSYVAEKVSGTIKTYSTKDEYAYVDGTKYKFAANFDGVKSNYDKDSTYDVYTTSDGYALAIVGVDDAKLDDVYYVVGVYASDSNYAGKTYYAQVVNVTTGEASEIKLEGTEQASAIASAITANARDKVFTAIGGLYTFEDKKTGDSKANNNKFNAIEYKGDSKFSYSIAKDTMAGNALSADVKKDSSSVSLNSGKTSTYVNKASVTAVAKKYINSATKFLTIESYGDDLDVTSNTGSVKCAKADADIAVIIYEKDSTKAAYVIFAGASFDTSISSTDVVYVNAGGDFDLNNDGDTVAANGAVYFMDGKTAKDVVLTGSDVTRGTLYEDAPGFYTFTTDKDDIYTLSAATSSEITSKVNKNTEGWAQIQVTSFEDGSYVLSAANFDDVDYENATVIDSRGSSTRDKDVYTGKITSVSDLNKALNKVDNYGAENNKKAWNDESAPAAEKGIVLDVYVEDGKITFIAVVSVRNADTAPEGGEEEVDSSVKNIKLTNDKKVTVTLKNAITGTKTVKVNLQVLNAGTTEYTTIDTVTVTVTNSNTGTTAEAIPAIGSGTYRIVYGDLTDVRAFG